MSCWRGNLRNGGNGGFCYSNLRNEVSRMNWNYAF
nr:MAG TPA: hypothetical protein [Caudoviricetes sp.]